MHWFFILLLIVLIVAGYYVYRRLLEIEREIRAEQRALSEEVETSEEQDDIDDVAVVSVVEEAGLTEKILARVEDNPGLTQTDLYGYFPTEDRREMQKILRELDQQGRLRREKKGNSYRLHPL